MVVLSPLESAFLQLESHDAPMHLASVGIFEAAPLLNEEGELRLAEVRALVGSRLHLVPKLRQRPHGGVLPQSPPTWWDDPTFDIDHHVRAQALPVPGDEATFHEVCGVLLSLPLPKDRPLWELVFLTGLSGGRVALVEKLHHSVADGLAAAELATVLLDLEPTPSMDPVTTPWRPSPFPPAGARAVQDLQRLTAIAFRVPTRLVEAMLHPLRCAHDALRFGRAVTPMLPFRLIAPASSLNTQISNSRDVRFLRMGLGELQSIAHERDATINDVLLTMVTGGLRVLLEARGELLEGSELQALVPVGLDRQGKRTTGNGVSCYFVRLPLWEGRAERALSLVSRETRAQKSREEELVPEAALQLLDPVPQCLLAESARLLRHQPFFNIIVTNVPGPPVPLYALGARMLEAFPIVPLLGNQGLAVAALSYVDAFHIGVFSNPEVCPDVESFVQGLVGTFRALAESKVPSPAEDRL